MDLNRERWDQLLNKFNKKQFFQNLIIQKSENPTYQWRLGLLFRSRIFPLHRINSNINNIFHRLRFNCHSLTMSRCIFSEDTLTFYVLPHTFAEKSTLFNSTNSFIHFIIRYFFSNKFYWWVLTKLLSLGCHYLWALGIYLVHHIIQPLASSHTHLLTGWVGRC